MRTLDVTGSLDGSGAIGSPDEWDQIAALVNPRSADPAPVLLTEPEVQVLAAAYLEMATAASEWVDRVAGPIYSGQKSRSGTRS